MNKVLAGTIYLAYFMMMIVFIYPEIETRFAALSISGNLGVFVSVFPMLILIVSLIVPAAFLMRD